MAGDGGVVALRERPPDLASAPRPAEEQRQLSVRRDATARDASNERVDAAVPGCGGHAATLDGLGFDLPEGERFGADGALEIVVRFFRLRARSATDGEGEVATIRAAASRRSRMLHLGPPNGREARGVGVQTSCHVALGLGSGA